MNRSFEAVYDTIIHSWLFKKGGLYSIAICRIFIYSSMLMTLNYFLSRMMVLDYNHFLSITPQTSYVPKGLVKFFPHAPPSAAFFYFIVYAAIASTWFSIVGFLGRVSTVISAFTVTFIVSLDASWAAYWSHAFNVQLLAAFAFMFGRSTDVLSVDALLRKLRGKPLRISNQAIYWWPVIAAELATHCFMLGAFYQKFHINGYWWSLSDNIRNALSISWYTYRSDPPQFTQLLISNPIFYKTAGTLQLIAQFTTIWSAFLVALPRVRIVIGCLLFIVEIFALNIIFDFWHPFWIPLAFLSVDWEWLHERYEQSQFRKKLKASFTNIVTLSRLGHLFKSENKRGLAQTDLKYKGSYTTSLPSWRYLSVLILFLLSFFGYYIGTIIFRWSESHLNYPFSEMGFYSDVKAAKPYNKHLYWPYYRGDVEVIEKGQTKPVPFDHVVSTYGEMWRYRSFKALHDDLLAIRTNLTSNFPYFWVRKNDKVVRKHVKNPYVIKLFEGISVIPPYPKSSKPIYAHKAMKAMLIGNDFYAANGSVHWDPERQQMYITVNSTGFKTPKYELLYRVNVREDVETNPLTKKLKPLAGQWVGGKYYIENKLKSDFFYTVIRVTDKKAGESYLFYGPDNFEDHV